VDEQKFILYENTKFINEDNEGDGLCLFYSVSTHLQYETNGGSSSIPDDWVAFRDHNNKKDFLASEAPLIMTRFLSRLSENDFEAFLLYYDFENENDKIIRTLPENYSSIVRDIAKTKLIKMEKQKREKVEKWIKRFIFDMIKASKHTYPGEVHAFVMSKILNIKIVFIQNHWNGLEARLDTDNFFVSEEGLSDILTIKAPTDRKICYLYYMNSSISPYMASWNDSGINHFQCLIPVDVDCDEKVTYEGKGGTSDMHCHPFLVEGTWDDLLNRFASQSEQAQTA